VSARVRLVVFGVGAAGLTLLFALAVAGLPPFGGARHPYRDLAVAASLRHATANVVSSVTFDQRGLDTLGEEVILLGSVVGATALLRPKPGEGERHVADEGRQLAAVNLTSYVFRPLTLLLGLDLMVHVHLTPGGGFQGGVVLATGLHLLYLSEGYRALQKLRPLDWYEWTEGLSTAAFAGIGIVGLVAGSGILANTLPLGVFQQLFSAGTVPLLNVVVGFAVGGGAVVLLAQFLSQALTTTDVEQAGRADRHADSRVRRRRLADPGRRLRHRAQPQPRAHRRLPLGGAVGHVRAAAGDRVPVERPGAGVQSRLAGVVAGGGSGRAGHDVHRHRRVRHGDRAAAGAHHSDRQDASDARPRRAAEPERLTCDPAR
jgi:multicomponent Na+:H+ antiporter subunit B